MSETVNSSSVSKIKEPFLRVVKRTEIPIIKKIFLYVIAIAISLLLGAVFLVIMEVNPIEFYKYVITGCFDFAPTSPTARPMTYFGNLVSAVMPLLITSLGIAIAFKMKFWNIGAEGQFIMGAIGAITVGLFFPSLPHLLLIILMAGAGVLFGGIYGLITAFFKVKFGTNETLLTLMFNYIALYIIKILAKTKGYNNPAGRETDFLLLGKSALVDKIQFTDNLAVDVTFIFCIVLTVALFVYFKYTKHGYEVAVVGESQNTARYAGINVKKVILRTMFLSAGIVGLAGMLQVAGSATSGSMSTGITSSVGWTGITVAWLAKLNPFAIVIVSILMCILSNGAAVAQSKLNSSAAISDILQSIILFTVLAADFFIRYQIVVRDNVVKRKIINPVVGFFRKMAPSNRAAKIKGGDGGIYMEGDNFQPTNVEEDKECKR